MGESETVTQQASKTNNSDKESFEEFFMKFKDDSIFQISRIKFPFTSIVWELGEDEPTTNQTDKMDWRYWNFHYEDNFASREIDAYTQEIKNYGDTVRIEIRGVDNGIFTDYDFVTVDNKWKLISEKDYSN
jgi:hypothetical protein